MTTHTSGPWRVATNRNNLATLPWSGAIGLEAEFDLAVPSIVAWTTRGGESEANARLIASAPDMLAALESIVVEADNGLDCHLLAEIAATAISKAKGL